MAAVEEVVEVDLEAKDSTNPLLNILVFWGLHVWVLAYSGVMLGAFYMQFVKGEFPCPLCMLQRYGMILSTIGALWIIMQARRGELTRGRYAQGLGMGLIGALAGISVSIRQIELHIMPGDPGYGEPVMRLHLYTWAAVTFSIVMLFVGVLLMLSPKAFPAAPSADTFGRTISTIIVWIFIVVVAANVIAIIFLEGFAFVLPDDPNSYNLLTQFGIK